MKRICPTLSHNALHTTLSKYLTVTVMTFD